MLSGLFALGALLSPLLLPTEHRLLRFVLAVSAMAVAFRALDLARDPRDHPLWMRLWIFVAVLDVRRLQPRARRIDWLSWGKALGYAGLAAAGYFVAFELASRTGGVWTWVVRWLGGCIAEGAGAPGGSRNKRGRSILVRFAG